MGEAKRRSERETLLTKLTRELLDQGKIIEAGWIALKLMTLPPDVSAVQEKEMRQAFFAGAQHLFGSIMSALDPDAEPTEADMRRMDQIDRELKAFLADLSARYGTGPAGHA